MSASDQAAYKTIFKLIIHRVTWSHPRELQLSHPDLPMEATHIRLSLSFPQIHTAGYSLFKVLTNSLIKLGERGGLICAI